MATSSTPLLPSRPSTPPSPPDLALLLLCLSTGLVDSLTYAVSNVWCAFVTGTTIQVGMDLPGLLLHLLHDRSPCLTFSRFISSSSSHRVASLACFVLGGYSASRAPASFTPARSTTLQSFLLALAALLVLLDSHLTGSTHLPYPHLTLGLISLSMSVQGVMVQRFSTPYATSVAWTSVWLSAVAPGGSGPRGKRIGGLAVLIVGAVAGASMTGYGWEMANDMRRSVNRVGWGLVVAAAVKAAAAAFFYRRGTAL